jgi:4-hydroxy-2-oxoglutarate aldolase
LRALPAAGYNDPALKHNHQPDTRNSTDLAPPAQYLRGVLLPFTTPFDEECGVDIRALRSNLEGWNDTGVAGHVVLGSTGERVHQEEREYLEVIDAARDCVPEGLALVVGAGQQGTRASVEEVRRVAEAGADAVLVITPHFYRGEMTQGVLVRHYLEVAEASPVPVVLYSVPHLTNVTIAPETVARLSEHENIVGVKDSSGDVLALAEMVRLVPEEFAVLTGNGSALYPALCVGARGGILAVGCIAPRLAVEVYEAFRAGEHERARLAQQRLSRVTRGVLGRYGISGLKAALDMLGYAGGRVRAPLQDASEEARREIEKVLRETGLLGGEAEGHLSAGARAE